MEYGANDLLLLALANHTGRTMKIFCSQKQQPVTDTQSTLTIFHPGNLGCCSHKSGATHSYQCVQYYCVSKQWYGCQRLGFLTCAQMLIHAMAHWGCVDTDCTLGLCGHCKSLHWKWTLEEKSLAAPGTRTRVHNLTKTVINKFLWHYSHSVQSTCCQASPPATSVALLLMLIAFI